jgi:hypothetical protein
MNNDRCLIEKFNPTSGYCCYAREVVGYNPLTPILYDRAYMVYGVPCEMNGSIDNVGRLDDNGDIGEN